MTEPRYQPSPATDDELLPVVDDTDNVVALERRADIHARGLKHRAVHVVVLNSRGELLQQRRSLAKDSFPGLWDISVGGHVNPRETYDQTAHRELREEMGITDAALVPVCKLTPTADNGWEFIQIYAIVHDGPITPDPVEIMDTRWVTPEEFLSRARIDNPDPDWRITPAADQTIRAWWNLGAPLLKI